MRSTLIRFTSGKLSPSWKILAAAVLLCASMLPAHAQQQPGPTQQTLTLKDPTPRPPDLEKIYGQGQGDQAKEQQAAALKSAQIHQQVVDASNKLYLLAQQLRDDVASGNKDSRTSHNAAKAAQIEKLAKTVREKTRTQ
jgi:hypothetical protein